MLRAGEGIVINYDGTGGEIAVSTAQWFVAEITGTVAATTPVNHTWKKKVPKKDGKSFEDANPPVIGDGTSNPAYLPALTTGTSSTAQVSGLVFMRLRSTNDEGQCVYEIVSGGGSGGGGGGGGSATIEVVTDVICTPTGIEVSTVTLSGADYDNAVIKQFLALSDVTPSSFLGNQGRVVKVNDAATALEFGAIGEGPTYTTFIALSDTPSEYGTINTYKTLTVSSTNNSLVFSANNITTEKSVAGGGWLNSPYYDPIHLVNDQYSPGNYYSYSTNASGVKGWNLLAATPAGLTVAGNVVVNTRKAAVADVAAHTVSNASLAAVASSTQTAIDDLTSQLNALLARIRSHGLIS